METTPRKHANFNERIDARRSQGQSVLQIVDYIYGLVKHNKVPLESLTLTPEEHAGFEERERIEQERKAKEAAEQEEQARRIKLYMEKREAEFQAQLQKMRDANLPTEHTVDAVRYDGELRGIEFDPDTMLKGATVEQIEDTIDRIVEAVRDYFSYDTPSPVPGRLVDKAMDAAKTPEQMLEVLSDVLDIVNTWDDSYRNKNLTVLRTEEPDRYEIVDLGDNCTYDEEVRIIGSYGLGEHYRFVDEEDEDDFDEEAAA